MSTKKSGRFTHISGKGGKAAGTEGLLCGQLIASAVVLQCHQGIRLQIMAVVNRLEVMAWKSA